MNDTVKMFLISLITAVLVHVLLGPQIMKMQQAQGLLPPFATTPVAGAGPGPGPGPGPAVQPQLVPQPVVQPEPGVAAIPAPNLVGTPIKGRPQGRHSPRASSSSRTSPATPPTRPPARSSSG